MRPRTLLLASCLLHCAPPIDAPTAFSGERYLCDAEHIAEFDALFEDCREERRAGGSCDGYMSFRGVIESEEVVLDAPVQRATYADPSIRQAALGRQVAVQAVAPYFTFRLDLAHFAIPPERSMSGVICGVAGEVPDVLCEDTPIEAESTGEILNLEARGGNFLSLLTSQVREVQFESDDELRLAVTANLARGGYIEGCYHIFPRQLVP